MKWQTYTFTHKVDKKFKNFAAIKEKKCVSLFKMPHSAPPSSCPDVSTQSGLKRSQLPYIYVAEESFDAFVGRTSCSSIHKHPKGDNRAGGVGGRQPVALPARARWKRETEWERNEWRGKWGGGDVGYGRYSVSDLPGWQWEEGSTPCSP